MSVAAAAHGAATAGDKPPAAPGGRRGAIGEGAAQPEDLERRAGLAQRAQRGAPHVARPQVGGAQARHAAQRRADAGLCERRAAAAQVQHGVALVSQRRQRGVAQQAAQARHRQQGGFCLAGQRRQDFLQAVWVLQQV